MELHDFLTTHRDELLARCRAKVASRPAPEATEAEIHGIPFFLDQLVAALLHYRKTTTGREIEASAAKHGGELLRRGLTVAQVVHDYGDLCQAVTELAAERNAPISTDDFRILNRCLDDAIAGAVTEYAFRRQLAADEGQAERLGSFAHELRNLLNAAILTYEVLKTGRAGVSGATGETHGRSLLRMKDLIDRTLTDVRLDAGSVQLEPIELAQLMADVSMTASLEAESHSVRLANAPVEGGIVIEADRQILVAAITNLLQNAFKFTRPHGRVLLRTDATVDRVVIEIEDECGGLRAEDPRALFRPFAQSSPDRRGVGLGLGIAQRGVKAMGGDIHVRDIPGVGCAFTIDLPRKA